MQIWINGLEEEVAESQTLEGLLQEKDKTAPWMAVAVNLQHVPSSKYGSTQLKPDDHVEILQPAQGG